MRMNKHAYYANKNLLLTNISFNVNIVLRNTGHK